ncbi:hypothetical protein AZH11_12905 [Pseudomonas simiae]|nr:hypothetical protein AZH11_12905 [Pseudomonas simiae]
MFTTYSRGEIVYDLPGEFPSPAGQRIWSFVEQELLLPWFYLQVVRRSGKESYASMLMMYHVHELKQFIDAQSNCAWVEQVQLVTPPHMNGHLSWLMEPLIEAGLVEDPRDGAHFVVYKVASGSMYSLRNDADVNLPPLKILFSSGRDLRT